ncbi:hypothetical protein KSF_095080 [Reticulibacter mediterranei]|uniref:Secreted protein n=1 Tax=Reticulibacter mediterranei TaxID=2778369 RepID=A0A8J3N8F1_9CHLR|nr:hypothetical protein [Reticulibacter mediterranei]GHO99460.1 hypothetical protein KSF_095080 [Reticulibacter mediterranei]
MRTLITRIIVLCLFLITLAVVIGGVHTSSAYAATTAHAKSSSGDTGNTRPVDCADNGTSFQVWRVDGNTACYAEVGHLNVRFVGVTRICSGNNVGEIRFYDPLADLPPDVDEPRWSFSKNQCISHFSYNDPTYGLFDFNNPVTITSIDITDAS